MVEKDFAEEGSEDGVSGRRLTQLSSSGLIAEIRQHPEVGQVSRQLAHRVGFPADHLVGGGELDRP
jgi:hypothetical protein